MVAPLNLALAIAAFSVVVLSVPFALSAIDHRRRNNGLAYMLLVTGIAGCNGMLFTQLISPYLANQVYFQS